MLSISNRARKFTKCDAFVGYQEDTPAAVVFQANNQLERLLESGKQLEGLESHLLAEIDINCLTEDEDNSEAWSRAVSSK